MARKREAKPPEPHPVSGAIKDVTESFLELASPVVKIVNLESILIEDCSAKRTPDAYKGMDASKIVISFEQAAIGRSKKANQFNVFLKFVLKAFVKNEQESKNKTKKPAVEIMAKFVLVYSIPSFEGIDDKNLVAFGETSGVFTAWPFWREYVHNSALRLSIPPIVLPTYRVT